MNKTTIAFLIFGGLLAWRMAPMLGQNRLMNGGNPLSKIERPCPKKQAQRQQRQQQPSSYAPSSEEYYYEPDYEY